MSTRDSLFRTILDNPEADAPRLAFADWLANNGESPRAAFIRAQIALQQFPPATRPADPWRLGFFVGANCWTEPPLQRLEFASTPQAVERNRLQGEINTLREEHADQWRSELPDDWPGKELIYHRGFVDHLEIPVAQLVLAPARYLDAAPIRSLTLGWAPGFALPQYEHAPVLAAIPQLARIERLDFSVAGREFVSAFVRAFVVMPEAANLRVLDLSRTDTEEDTLHAVLESDQLRELQTLHLTGNTLSADFLEALGATNKLSGLRMLSLSACKLTREGAERFFRGRLMGQLTGLNLSWNAEFGEGGAAALAACQHLKRFRFLTLAYNAIADGGCRRLSESPFATNLEAFQAERSGITGTGVAELLNSSSLPRLHTLMLARNPIDAASMTGFADTTPTIPLRRLDLSYCPIGDDGVRLLAESPLLQSITHLKLRECGIGDTGVTALAGSTRTTALRELNLGHNALTDAAAEALAASDSLRNLERLDVYGNQITDRGGLRLTDLPGLHPYGLWIGGDPITRGGEEKIKKRMEARRKSES